MTWIAKLLHASAIASFSIATQAMERGTFLDQRTYATGGVGEGEIARLQAERPSYSLKLITAARGTGEYLADAHVRIADSRRKVIFDRDLDGPWLLIDLPPGRYEVQTSYKGQSQIKMTTISHQQLREADFYFDSNGD